MPDEVFLPTRSLRQLARRAVVAVRCALVVAALLIPQGNLDAQRADSVRAGAPQPAPATRDARQQAARDSLRPPISGRRAFLYSFLVPGWGQSRLQRPLAGAIFTTIEISLVALIIKTSGDLSYAKAHAADSIVAGFEYNADGTVQVDPETGDPVVRYAPNRYDADRISAREQHLEDYIALLVGNHLFAGLEAFVSAHLWDLPARVGFRMLPRGGTAVGATIPW